MFGLNLSWRVAWIFMPDTYRCIYVQCMTPYFWVVQHFLALRKIVSACKYIMLSNRDVLSFEVLYLPLVSRWLTVTVDERLFLAVKILFNDCCDCGDRCFREVIKYEWMNMCIWTVHQDKKAAVATVKR